MDDFERLKSRVYILTDEEGRVLRLEGEYSLPADLTGWTLVEEGEPCDRLNLAQSNFLPKPLRTEDGLCRYKLADGEIVERSEDEIQEDRDALPTPVSPKTNAELESENALLKQQVSALADQQSFYEDCIAEMAAVVYA